MGVQTDTITDAAGTGAPDLTNGAKFAGGTDILADYEVYSGTLDGGFTGGTLGFRIVKVGRLCILNGLGTPTHSNASAVQTNDGLLPARFRPSTTVSYQHQSAAASMGNGLTIIQTGGRIRTEYTDYSGAGQNRTDTNGALQIVWSVP